MILRDSHGFTKRSKMGLDYLLSHNKFNVSVLSISDVLGCGSAGGSGKWTRERGFEWQEDILKCFLVHFT